MQSIPLPFPCPKHRRSEAWAITAVIVGVLLFQGSIPLSAQTGGNSYAKHRFDFYQPAPAAVADYYPAVYAGSKILRSAQIDEDNNTVTMPLYQGAMKDGRTVWYVLTDVSDPGIAAASGLNYSAKLANVNGKAARTATMASDGSLIFDQGTVDFSPEQKVVPGDAPNFFPPKEVQAGSIGDEDYSPLVRVTNANNIVYNATIVAFDVDADEIEFPNGEIDYSKVIDRATAISPANGTITFRMSLGTSAGRPVLFISLDSNDTLVSALEGTNVAPGLKAIPVGVNDNPGSAVSVNYIIANGPTGVDNPQKQGLNSALGDAGAQLFDIFDGAPGVVNDAAYSPMWDLYVAAWSQETVDKGYRSAIYSELQFWGLAKNGWLTAPDGNPVGPSGLISNCPLLMHY